jgi:hypothetical protein
MSDQEGFQQAAVNATKEIIIALIEKGDISRPSGNSKEEYNANYSKQISSIFAAIYSQIYGCMTKTPE